MKAILAILFFFFLAMSQVEARIFYVQPSGSATNDCTAAQNTGTPRSTITNVITNCGITGGDTIEVRANTPGGSAIFAESFQCGTNICIPGGSSWSSPVVLTSRSGDSITIRPAAGTARAFDFRGFSGVSQQYIQVNGFILDCTNCSAHVIQADNDGGSPVGPLKITNNIMTAPLSTCIQLTSNVSNNEIGYNEVHHCGTNDLTYGPGYNPFYFGGDGNWVHHNVLHDNVNGIALWDSAGQRPDNNIVEFNTVHDSGLALRDDSQCYFSSGINNIFRYNVGYRCPIGIRTFGQASADLIYKNTFYEGANTGGGPSIGIQLQAGTGHVVVDNIFRNFTISIEDTSGGTNTKTNNFCSQSNAGCTSTANPLFVDPTSPARNFNLSAGSPAIDAGISKITASINIPTCSSSSNAPGCYSGVAPDVGAYEYATFTPSVAWTNDRGGSGTASGTANWKTDVPPSGIPLKSGDNPISVTATDNTGQTATDTITITYAPTFPGATLALAYGFEEASGNAVDSSANTNTGTLNNGPTRLIGTGRFGNGVSLNGVNQFISANTAPSLDFTQSFTFSAYVKPHTTYNDFRALMTKGLTTGSGYIQFLYATVAGYCGSGRVLGGFTANGTLGPQFAACDPTTPISNTWTHLALTYSNTTGELKLYKNGTLVTTTSASGYMEPSTAQLRIGASQFGEYLDADVDEVRAYNWAIPAVDSGKLNTVFGNPCGYRTDTVVNAAADRLNMALVSVMGDANCAVIQPAAPTGPVLKIPAAASGVKVSSGSSLKLSQ